MITVGILTAVPAILFALVSLAAAALIYPYARCFLKRGIGGDCHT
ncbi:hypothetical protein [Thiohalomonas denitrificans]|uniref:Uncharacterized protein n=1 Tax=Thiohalomonas denitrificans TaxID=415747 RepID=A0A1G5Q281_9GAMM|nr:hypothetical protein [Thiohalomonas denitrificans]SCZ55560.1 hypothetical protein SAMN03097708_01151 [Thiohalomonas denitrificans]